MKAIGKNIIIVLGIALTAGAGYYVFTQDTSLVLRSTASDQQFQQILFQTRQFVEHRQVLDNIQLDTSVLQSPELRSLRSFAPTPQEFRVGRENPFAPVGFVTPIAPAAPTANDAGI